MLKVELHAHTADDPADRIAHTTVELIERAASLGYHALAVTLHDRYFDPRPHGDFARARGLTLLSGIELTIEGKHLLLINFPPAIAAAATFEDVARLKAGSGGLVIAPHPFYPIGSALGSGLDDLADLVDAVEINSMFTRQLDFNRRARAWARARHKPLVGNTDLHVLSQLGTTYTLVDAEASPDAICAAVREGRVEVRTEALTVVRAAALFARMCWRGLVGRTAALFR